MAENGWTPEQQRRLGELLALPPEQWAALTGATPVTPPDTTGEVTDAELDALIGSITDEELAELEAEAEEPVSVGAQAGLSAEHLMAIEMSRTQSEDALAQLREINTELDSQKFETERRRLADAGVPFYLTDLARPLLEGAGHVIEMSNGTAVDAGQIMRKVLGEVGRAAGLLDLSDELGSALDEPEQHQQATAERDDLVAQAKAVMGFR